MSTIDTVSDVHLAVRAISVRGVSIFGLLLVRALQWLLGQTGSLLSLIMLVSVLSRGLCWRILQVAALLRNVSCVLARETLRAVYHVVELGRL